MASRTWTASIARFAKRLPALLPVVAIATIIGDTSRDRSAEACGGFGPSIYELTTFDPDIVGDSPGLDWLPDLHGFGGVCDECSRDAILADWIGYLPGVKAADWQKILYEANPTELQALDAHLLGKGAAPTGYDASSVWSVPAQKDRLHGALQFVSLARAIEPVATLTASPQTLPPLQLASDAKLGFKSARDPFMSQRYAYQLMRVSFYRRDWPATIAFFDKNTAALSTPSTDIAARAHYYLAGALRRNGNAARANLEFARVHAMSKALAGAAAEDFKPQDEADWREALRLAKTPREKAELWRLVGLTKGDGITAINEILKIDPKSNLIALLLVRELGRTEGELIEDWDTQKPDPKRVAEQRKSYATLEKLAQRLQATAGVDRPWLAALVLCHIAAKRGDFATARAQMKLAIAGKPGDVRVASQAKASLALALALDYKSDPAREDEIARAMNEIDKSFGRATAVRDDVRGRLAHVYFAAGKIVDAEFLKPGTVDPTDEWGAPTNPKAQQHWSTVAFVKEMIARSKRTTTAFDRFVVDSPGLDTARLQRELAFRQLLDGDAATGLATFSSTKQPTDKLGTDPFVIHILDCHDCDHDKYEKAPWTHASVMSRMVELQKAANGKGQAAADAAFALGNAYYNMSYWGNARMFLEGTFQQTKEPREAERWYDKAFTLGTSREFKAKAAFMAAKAEMGRLMAPSNHANNQNAGLPMAMRWFAVEKTFKDTKYYQEVLKECSMFASFVASQKP